MSYYDSAPVLRESHPAPEDDEPSSTLSAVPFIVSRAIGSAACVAQLIVNARSGTFAGAYALGAVFDALGSADSVAKLFLRRKMNYYSGLTVRMAVKWAIKLVALVQALTLPRVEQVVPEEED